jgi:3-hydroxybutyryl-CoA dehydrogenase
MVERSTASVGSTGGGVVSGIQRVAVIGLGTMGHGIAQTFALAGCRVTGYDDVAAARASALDRIRQNLVDFAGAGLLAPDEIEPVLARIAIRESEAEAVRDAECITEAIVEDLPAKQDLLARLEDLVADETILASNSSTFPISQSGARLRRPERAIVTHWFNPPHIVPTVEVVGGPRTAESTIAAMLELLRRAGKLAIRINQELPGFVVNRVQIAVMRELWDLLDRGVASVEDIDAAIQGSMGFRLAALGPLRIQDFGGMDVNAAVFRNLAPEIASGTDVPGVVQRMVDAGHFGFKTGQGFYAYPPETADRVRSDRDARYLSLLKLFHSRQEKHPL